MFLTLLFVLAVLMLSLVLGWSVFFKYSAPVVSGNTGICKPLNPAPQLKW